MKVLQEKYPKGTFKSQHTDGRYVDGYLYSALDQLADKIVDDMTFMSICFSSTLEVGTGKSVLCTQIGEIWTDIMNRKHGLNLTFTQKNLIFRPKDLITRAFEVPKYSFLLVDEWEDATYWSELGMSLRTFFRKCRQLNLFIMIIIPNFFQLNLSYAVSRSVFAIDVKFERGFERGFFDFYSFKNKRTLYIKGKKEHNYHVTRPDFFGRFLDGYGVPEKEYRAAKLRDMMTYDDAEDKVPTEKEITIKLFKQLHQNLPKISALALSEAFGISSKTGYRWLNDEKDTESEDSVVDKGIRYYNMSVLNDKVIDYSKEEELPDLGTTNSNLPTTNGDNTDTTTD